MTDASDAKADPEQPSASPYVRLPVPVVAGALFLFLAVLLAFGLYANANLRLRHHPAYPNNAPTRSRRDPASNLDPRRRHPDTRRPNPTAIDPHAGCRPANRRANPNPNHPRERERHPDVSRHPANRRPRHPDIRTHAAPHRRAHPGCRNRPGLRTLLARQIPGAP
jgi:hypothetical protein